MARRRVDPSSIRDRAFALAVVESPPPHQLMVLARATEYQRYLLWSIECSAPTTALRRLVAACFRWRLLAEWKMIAQLRSVVHRLLDPQCSVHDLRSSIQAEIEARRAALLGDANCPPVLSVLAKQSHVPEVQDQLAMAFRERRVDVVRGKVFVRIHSHVSTIAALYLVASGWLVLVFSHVPLIRDDPGSATMVAGVALALQTFLFWPVIQTIAVDKRLRDIVNLAPHIR